jgi:hypothetical protein
MREDLLTPAKSAAAGTLTVLAHGLQLAARTVQRGASLLRPPSDGDADRALERLDEAVGGEEGALRPDGARERTAAEAAAAPANRPARHVEPQARAAQEPIAEPAHRPPVVADLASRRVREITAEIDRLSANELHRLREHEQAGRRRKTVLEAIDRSLERS